MRTQYAYFNPQAPRQAENVPEGVTPYVAHSRHLRREIGIPNGPPNADAPNPAAWLAATRMHRQGKGTAAPRSFGPNERGLSASRVCETASAASSFPPPLDTMPCEVSYSAINMAAALTCK